MTIDFVVYFGGFDFLERRVLSFVAIESPAIRSYHQATRTFLLTHIGDTTTIGASWLGAELIVSILSIKFLPIFEASLSAQIRTEKEALAMLNYW